MECARVRDGVMRDADRLDNDHVQGEFECLAKGLGWSATATLKDLRHLFATTLNNAGVPNGYVRYLMAHAPGKAALIAYTHLDQLRRHYSAALQQKRRALLEIINQRAAALHHRPVRARRSVPRTVSLRRSSSARRHPPYSGTSRPIKRSGNR